MGVVVTNKILGGPKIKANVGGKPCLHEIDDRPAVFNDIILFEALPILL